MRASSPAKDEHCIQSSCAGLIKYARQAKGEIQITSARVEPGHRQGEIHLLLAGLTLSQQEK
jgi:hypothetical protein